MPETIALPYPTAPLKFYPTQQDHPFDTTLPPVSVARAYALMLFSLVGVFGIAHFYLGRPVKGTIWLLTFGVFGLGALVDLVTMYWQVKQINRWHSVGVGAH
jgi:TM2 domain-containing membrane protein YozV